MHDNLNPKKNSYKEFDYEKNSCGSKIPHLLRNFSNGPSLTRFNLLWVSDVIQFTISWRQTRDF